MAYRQATVTHPSHIRTLLALATAFSLLYALTGSLVDHHFSERLPYHGHVFLSSIPAPHGHAGYQDHVHTGASHDHGNVVYTPDSEGSGSPEGSGGWQLLALAPSLALVLALLTSIGGFFTLPRVLTPVLSPGSPPPRPA